MLWEILKASKGILVADFYADLWANIAGGGTPVDVFVEMIGTLPLYYDGKGIDLADYLISGNAIQDGTPSPDAPVDVVGCGVRTGNLAPPLTEWEDGYVAVNGTISIPSATLLEKVTGLLPIPDGSLYLTFSGEDGDFVQGKNGGWRAVGFYDRDGAYISRSGGGGEERLIVKAPSNSAFMRICCRTYGSDKNYMLNLGYTALTYEPYGYKLPLTINGVEYPIYLGQVETTRRVKKLVLTGEEGWYSASTDSNRTVCRLGRLMGTNAVGYCTHIYWKSSYEAQDYNRIVYINNYDNGSLYVSLENRLLSGQTVADFKSYLAAQYAAGTPVTVWYVLAEPETAVVNEPLMKIGDYADTISFAQSQVAIPTVNGTNVLDMASTVKPSEIYIKGKGIKPTGYGQLTDVNGVNILDKDGRPIYVHGQ